MPRIRLVYGAGMLLALGGCGDFVATDAVLAEQDMRFDGRLVGTWLYQNGDSTADTAVVTRGESNAYEVSYAHHGKLKGVRSSARGRFSAAIGMVGRRLMLDFTPNPDDGELPDAYDGLLLPLHRLVGIEITADSVVLTEILKDSLLAALASGRVALPSSGRDVVILHATTPRLREQLAAFVAQPGAFSDERATWYRAASAR